MYSFQHSVNPKSAAHTSPGTAIGSKIRVSVCMRLAPSTSAHSSTSRGTVRKYPISSHVENGTRNVGYVRTRAQIESDRPSQLITCDSGRKSSVGGTRYVMNTAVPNEPTPRYRSRARL